MSMIAGDPVVVPAAPVVEATTLGAYRVLWFDAPGIARAVVPGQFVNIAGKPGGSCVLRRPFSVYRVNGDAVSVVFDLIGEGTRWLAARQVGQTIDVVGPLGNGFWLPEEPGAELLVGGGYGGAAMSLLAERLRDAGNEPHAILGARSADRVFEDRALDEVCASVTITTDDGSAGTKGIVTLVMPELLEKTGARTVYACGPMRMLEAVSAACERLGVASQLAVEEFMACGIGVCWTCVLPVRAEGVRTHARTCTEGPVFAGSAVAWA